MFKSRPRRIFPVFLFPAEYWLLRTRKHKANRYFRARNMLPRNNADVTHCKKTCSIFKTKRSTELKTRQRIFV